MYTDSTNSNASVALGDGVSVRVEVLATSIADSTTKRDIWECCPRIEADGHKWWVLIKSRPHKDEVIARLELAEHYLQLRGLLVYHPLQPLLVRLVEDQ